MTRKKKTRSIKSRVNIKTGSISKLKKAANNDRQVGKRIKGRRTPSAYEKFLADNADAKQKAVAEQVKQQQKSEGNKSTSKELVDTKPAKPTSKEKGLFDQLDDQNFDDIY